MGFVLAFVGITFVINVQTILDFNTAYLVGNLLLIFAMLSWGIYPSVVKTVMNTLSLDEVTAGSIFVGWEMFGVRALAKITTWQSVLMTSTFWWNILFLGGFSSFLGFMFYFESIKRIGATKIGGFISLIPVFGTATTILLLQEAVFIRFVLELVFVVIGILVINAPIREKAVDEMVVRPLILTLGQRFPSLVASSWT